MTGYRPNIINKWPYRPWLTPGILFIIALTCRLIYLFFLKNHYFFYSAPSADVSYYLEWARDIAQGKWLGDSSFLGLPLYPYFLSVLTRLTYGHVELIRLAHLLLGSLNCVLVYFIGKKIFSSRVGVIASLLAATNYTVIYYDWLIMPVPLIISLTLLLTLSFLYQEQIRTKREWFWIGIFLGLVILGDGKFLFFLIYIVLCLAWTYFKRKDALLFQRRLLPLILGVIVILSLSAFRYKLISGHWVFLSSQSGLSLYAGNNPQATGVYDHPAFLRPDHFGQDQDQRIIAENIAHHRLSSEEVSAFWRNKAVEFIVQRPQESLRLFIRKFQLFFTDTEWAHDIDLLFQRKWRLYLDFNPFFLICPLAILGIFVTGRSRNGQHYLYALLACQLLVTVVFFLTTRHRASILPLLFLYEAAAINWFIEQIINRRVKKFILAIGFMLFFVWCFPSVSADQEFLTYLASSKAAPIYEKEGQFKLAFESYQTALKIRPYDSVNIFNLGNLYLKTGDMAKAETQYLTALKICPYNIDALFNLAFLYQQIGRKEDALRIYEQVLTYEPKSPDAHYRMAQIYQENKNCTKANQHFNLIIQQQPILKETITKYMKHCP